MYKEMRIVTYLVLASFLIVSSCAGLNKKLRKSPAPESAAPQAKTTTITKTTTTSQTAQPAEKKTLAPAGPIKEVEEKLVPVEQKAPDPHKYFVIIGSFRNPDNAKKYQAQLELDGFASSELLRNEAGLYRVSVMATDEIDKARAEIRRIRNLFAKYFDTWLLIQKK